MDVQDHVDVTAGEVKGGKAKARRKPGAKAPTENGKRSLNLRIDEDSYRRLNIHALMLNKTVSELVMEFAHTHLREFSMPHRLGGKPEQGE